MTGTEGCPASPSTSACGPTRATTAATMLDSTMLVSFSDSFTPNWISSFPKKRPEPPIVVTAASVETRVRVLRLLKFRATVLPTKAF